MLKPKLSEKDKNQVKEIAIELLDTLKKESLKVENWAGKDTTASTVRNVISMYLFQKLPEPYTQLEVDEKSNALFFHLRSNYYGSGMRL